MRSTVLALCAAAVLQSQPPQPQAPTPTFKSTTELVEVDAVVLDKHGNFVPGLTADKLTLYENGKPQKIQQFFMVTHDQGVADGSIRSEYADQAEAGAHRVFVMLFDEAHLSNEALQRAKDGAGNFVRDMFTAGDAGGVFVNGGMYKGRLTIDKAELLGGIRAVQPAFENRQAILAPFRQWPRINDEVEASRITDGRGQLLTRLASQACSEDPAACASEGGIANVENIIQRKARLYVRQARLMTERTITSLERIANG